MARRGNRFEAARRQSDKKAKAGMKDLKILFDLTLGLFAFIFIPFKFFMWDLPAAIFGKKKKNKKRK